MKNDREIGRITHDGIQYILGADFWDIEARFPMPYILVTLKSSKKNREDKKVGKHDAHFSRIDINNPIGFYRKAYPIFYNFLKNYDYVIFSANKDFQEKRERVYQKVLEKMGFKLVYIYQYDYRGKDFLMAKEHLNPKKKEIKKMIEFLGA